MEEIFQQLIDEMSAHGLSPARPSDIKCDNKRHDYQVVGEKNKKGFYKAEIDGDFGYGFFGHYKTNECHSWHSKIAGPKRTPEEIARLKATRERKRLEQEKAQAELHQQRAKEAQDSILFLNKCTDAEHPYLKKKAIVPRGDILLSGLDLILPLIDGENVVNTQTIMQDGTKLFMKDAKKQGTYFIIPGSDTTCICEGYATGVTIHEATGYTVYVALDAGNLLFLAQSGILKPDIICADNDHETVIRGKPYNTGLEKGRAAADECGAKIAYPEFTSEDVGLSDFNDYAAKYGLDAVKNRILEAQSAEARDAQQAVVLPLEPAGIPPSIEPDWQEQLITNSKGAIEPRSTVNILLITEHDEMLAGCFIYDSFAKQIVLAKAPPWMDEQTFKVRRIMDADYIRLEAYLERTWGVKASKDKCADAINSVANLEKNTINPATKYFDSIIWDGVPRLDDFLKKYISDGRQNDAYLKIVGSKFLMGLANRALNPGCKFDTMIILEGKQYAGKSYLSRVMSRAGGEEHFLDDFRDIENKDSLQKIQGKLVVEFPEITTMRKSEVNELKAFMSRQEDEYRPPYGRNPIVAPRQCVFIGTVNPEGPYLRDITGNRRYWPVSCRDRLPIDDLIEIMPQLHAEAAHRVKAGEPTSVTFEEQMICHAEQDKRVQTDLWIDQINDIVEFRDEISTDELFREMGLSTDKKTQMAFTRVNQCMTVLGFEARRVRVGNSRRRGYARAKPLYPKQKTLQNDEEIKW